MTLPRILCVDDEPMVLDALERNLDEIFEIHLATSGAQGLDLLRRIDDVTVVMSDMRMPEMDGADFLAKVPALAPEAVRILLTGQSHLNDASRAVNSGGLFRFLLKPCPTAELQRALLEGVAHYRLQRAEREMLDKTVRGTIQLLAGVLQLSSPSTFRTGATAQRVAAHLASRLALPDRWAIESAALLAPMGMVALPEALAERGRSGERLSADERAQFSTHPATAQRLLEHVPRLEEVGWLIGQQMEPGPKQEPATAREKAACVVRVAVRAAELIHTGVRRTGVVERLSVTLQGWDKRLLTMLDVGPLGEGVELKLRIEQLKPGMVLVNDVTAPSGMLLANAGLEISLAMIERLRRFRDGMGVREPLCVRIEEG